MNTRREHVIVTRTRKPLLTPCGSAWVVYYVQEPRPLVPGMTHAALRPTVTFSLCANRAAAMQFAKGKAPR